MGRTCTPTLSCLEVPPCTLVLLTECKKKSLPWLHPPSKSRLLLLQKENTLYGLEVPFWLLSPLSSRCGSQNKNMTNVVHPLFTENAFKCFFTNQLFILINRLCDIKFLKSNCQT